MTISKINSTDTDEVMRALEDQRFDENETRRHEDLVGKSWVTYDVGLQRLKLRVETDQASIPLSNEDFFEVRGGFQPPVSEIKNFECSEAEYLALPRKERALAFPAIQDAGEIRRYSLARASRFWVIANDVPTPEELRREYPAIYALLSSRMSTKPEAWWHFPNIRNFEIFKGSQKKILCPRTASEVSFALDDAKRVFKGTNTMIISKVLAPEFVVGVLNSKLANFWYSEFGSDYHGGSAKKYEPEKAREFLMPILRGNEKVRQAIAERAESIATKKQRLSSFGDKKTIETARIEDDIKRIDSEIDELVFGLYGITKDERARIERPQ